MMTEKEIAKILGETQIDLDICKKICGSKMNWMNEKRQRVGRNWRAEIHAYVIAMSINLEAFAEQLEEE